MQPETLLIFTAFVAVVGISVFTFWRVEQFIDRLQESRYGFLNDFLMIKNSLNK